MTKSMTLIAAANRKFALLFISLLGTGAVGLEAWQASAGPSATPVIAYANDRTNNRLRSFDLNSPSTFLSNIAFTGLIGGEQVVGIDFRPSTGGLYGVATTGTSSRLILINTTTGAVTQVGSGFTPSLPTNTFYGVDFDPVADQLRVVSFNDVNIRINPSTGALVATDSNLAYAATDPNVGNNPAIDLLAISSYFPGAPQTTTFGIDTAKGNLVRIGGVNGVPSAGNGQLTTIGPLGIGALFQSGGFDIDINGNAFLTLNNNLYQENLTTGQATLIGGFTAPVDGMAISAPVSTTVTSFIVTGPDSGTQSIVNVFDGSNLQLQFSPFDSSFRGGVRVAVADVDNDGKPDFITGTGSGDSRVKVISGADNRTILRDFFAFQGFAGGVYVAAGDVNGDGRADIIVGAGAGGGPQIKVYSGVDNSLLTSFFAYSPTATSGVRVAAGDVNGDGKADIIAGLGPGQISQIKVFSGADLSEIRSFEAYATTFTGGVFVGSGDVNGDGFADIITGPDAGAGPQVKVFSGVNPANVLFSFFAYDSDATGGVRVAGGDFNGDGRADIVTAPGPGTAPTEPNLFEIIQANPGPQVRVFSGFNGSQLRNFLAYPVSFQGGVYIAGIGTPTAAPPTPTPTLTPTPTPIPTPTPSLVTVSGRVVSSSLVGLRNATVSMTDSAGVARTATTSSFGFFSFPSVLTGGQYVFRVQSRSYRYSATTVTVRDNLTLPEFVGLE